MVESEISILSKLNALRAAVISSWLFGIRMLASPKNYFLLGNWYPRGLDTCAARRPLCGIRTRLLRKTRRQDILSIQIRTH
jgi:hypothetical protein